jgi:hypothetical protein
VAAAVLVRLADDPVRGVDRALDLGRRRRRRDRVAVRSERRLLGGGLLNRQLTSGDFMRWGKAGKGSWITVYAHGDHGFLVIAGLRFDTGWNNAGQGPRWSEQMRPTGGYAVRHPAEF